MHGPWSTVCGYSYRVDWRSCEGNGLQRFQSGDCTIIGIASFWLTVGSMIALPRARKMPTRSCPGHDIKRPIGRPAKDSRLTDHSGRERSVNTDPQGSGVPLVRPASTGTPSSQMYGGWWTKTPSRPQLQPWPSRRCPALRAIWAQTPAWIVPEPPVARIDHGFQRSPWIMRAFCILLRICILLEPTRQDYSHGVDRRVCTAGAELRSARAVDKRDPF